MKRIGKNETKRQALKRFGLVVGGLVLLVNTVIGFMPISTVSAGTSIAPPNTNIFWQNVSVIHVTTNINDDPGFLTPTQHTISATDGQVNSDFFDSNIGDTTNRFAIQGASGCAAQDYLTGPASDSYQGSEQTTARVDLFYPDPGNNNKCTPYTFDFNGITTQNNDQYFEWAGSTLQTLDGSKITLTSEGGSNSNVYTGQTTKDILGVCHGVSPIFSNCKATCYYTVTVDPAQPYVTATNPPVAGGLTAGKTAGIKSGPLPTIYCSDHNHNFLTNDLTGTATIGGVAPGQTVSNGGAPSAAGAGGDNTATPGIDCSVSILNPLSWFICPLAVGLESIAGGLDNEIQKSLTVSTQGWDTSYRPAWLDIRNISLGLIAIATLIAIISQAAGFEFLDAYTIRKALPRVLIVAIGISVSWPVLKEFVAFTNDLGNGVGSIINLAATGKSVAFGGGGSLVLGLITGGAVLSLGFVGLLSFAATAALAVAIAFLVLALRQMIIILLVIFSPIAFACYVLPNTQKVWKLWWDSFSKGLLMFPLIVALLAVGKVFAVVSSQGNKGSVDQVLAFVGYFAPYFLIPFTFRLAGGALATIGGGLHSRSQGAFNGLRQFRGRRAKQNFAALKAGNRIKADNALSRKINPLTRDAALVAGGGAGFNPKNMKARLNDARSTHKMNEAAEYMKNSLAFQAISGNDDFLQATNVASGGGHTAEAQAKYLKGLKRLDEDGNETNVRKYTDDEVNQGVAGIRAARRGTNDDIFYQSAVLANFSTSTGWKKGGAVMASEAINEVAGSDRSTAARMLAEAGSRAERTGRLDQNAGFGTRFGVLDDLYKAQNEHGGDDKYMEEVRLQSMQTLADNIFETKGVSALVGANGHAVKNLAPHLVKRLQRIQAKVGQAAPDSLERENAERAVAQEYANLAGLGDVMSHGSAEVARFYADDVMNADITTLKGEKLKVSDMIKRLQDSGDKDFMQARRDFDAIQAQRQKEYAKRGGPVADLAEAAERAEGYPEPPPPPEPEPPA